MARRSRGSASYSAQVQQNLRRFRDNWSMTQEEAATEAGVPVDNWRRYERGDNGVPLDTLKAIADFFKTTVDEFMKEEPRLPPPEWRPFLFFRASREIKDPKVRERAEEIVRKISDQIADYEKELRALKRGE